jgi:predicted kinase
MLTVVTGPPCVGKTTYVQQHALPGHIVVDFDALAQALGSPVSHGHDHPIWKTTADARDAAIRTAVECHRQGATAWIIDSRPTPAARRRYLEAGGRIVDLTAPAAELHRRADAAGRPAAWHHRIDQFLASTADAALQTRTTW